MYLTRGIEVGVTSPISLMLDLRVIADFVIWISNFRSGYVYVLKEIIYDSFQASNLSNGSRNRDEERGGGGGGYNRNWSKIGAGEGKNEWSGVSEMRVLRIDGGLHGGVYREG